MIFLIRIRKHWARSKTRKTWKFFSEIFKSEFSILAIGQNWKLGNKKTRNNISEISKISEVSKFSICHFSFFKKHFLSIFYSRQFRTFYLCYVCLQSLLKCFFLHQKYMFKLLPCRNKIYFLWDVSSLMRTRGMLIGNSMKDFNLCHA